MHTDYFGYIGPAVMTLGSLGKALRRKQLIGSLVVASLMAGAIVLALAGVEPVSLALEGAGLLLAVILFLYERRWTSAQRSTPLNVWRWLGAIGAVAATATLIAFGINTESPLVRHASWAAFVVMCLWLALLAGRLDGPAAPRDGEETEPKP